MFKETIYNHSPVFFQNIITSMYGLQLHWQRYGGNNSKYTEELERSEHANEQYLLDFQKKELLKLLRHAYLTTEYYKNLFDKIGLKPEDIKTLHDLNQIPILTKQDIKKNSHSFLSKIFPKRQLHTIFTSGTTGSPLTVFYNRDARRKNYAFFNRTRKWKGTKLGDKRVTLYGRSLIPPNQKGPPFWRYDVTENNYLFSSYHLTPVNLPHYYKEIKKIQPVEIRGYPSSLHTLALYMRENKLSGIRPKAIFTTAETLFDSVRKTIESAFCCEVTDTYGCTEMGFYITQCEYGTYHTHPEYGIVEALGSNGTPVTEQPGELVCTSFINYAMPLIRYKVGDTITLENRRCPCGRKFPVVSQILGRTDDLIITPEGRSIGRLDPIFKGGLGIHEAQIIQTGTDEIVFKIVKSKSYTESDRDFLYKQLHNRIGPSMKIRFEFVPEIQKDKNGKFRAVVSLLDHTRDSIKSPYHGN